MKLFLFPRWHGKTTLYKFINENCPNIRQQILETLKIITKGETPREIFVDDMVDLEKKEDKMDETTKIIREIERKISRMTQHIVICIDELAVALKELVPKVIEEKEVELKDGQIYKLNRPLTDYYLLQCDYRDYPTFFWSLMNLKTRNSYWASGQTSSKMKNVIRGDFTLCPDAYIRVYLPLKIGGNL